MVWAISQQPGKSDFSRPLQGPLRSVFLENSPFKPRIIFDGGWSTRFNFSLEPQLIKSKMPSQLKNHFHWSSYLECTGQLNLVAYSFVSQWFLANWKGAESHSQNGAGRAKMPSICAFICPLSSLYATISLGATTSNINPESVEGRVCPVGVISLFDPKGTWTFQIL